MMAKYSEAQKRSSIKYEKENLVRVALSINKNTESEIAEWLSQRDNKQGYLKELIRADMKAKQLTIIQDIDISY